VLKPVRALYDDIRSTFGYMQRPTLVALLVAPILLTWLEFCSGRQTFTRWFGDTPFGASSDIDVHLLGWEWWSLNVLVAFVVLPVLLIKFVLREDLGNYGLRRGDVVKHAAIGFSLFLLNLPFVIMAARTASFQHMYPLFTEARLSVALLLQWWVVYLPMFFAVEFFFRGYLLFSLERQLGPAAIFVCTVPYCMVHFHKPMAEAFAAIVAGIVLGYVALRTRCIWSGVLVHLMVAITMDLLAIFAFAAPV